MIKFKLDSKLADDCIALGRLNCINLLLMNNSRIPWFILVPETDKTELFELEETEKQLLYKTVNDLCLFVKTAYDVDKLNVATIGNVVSQLHVHVVGRSKNDYCWPGVVWGAKTESSEYTEQEITYLRDALQAYFPGTFAY